MVCIELTPEEVSQIQWAEKHEVPSFWYDPLLKIVGRSRDFTAHIRQLHQEGRLPRKYEKGLTSGQGFTPLGDWCTPLQAHLLEFNFRFTRI